MSIAEVVGALWNTLDYSDLRSRVDDSNPAIVASLLSDGGFPAVDALSGRYNSFDDDSPSACSYRQPELPRRSRSFESDDLFWHDGPTPLLDGEVQDTGGCRTKRLSMYVICSENRM